MRKRMRKKMGKRRLAAGILALAMVFSVTGIRAEAETKIYDNGDRYEGEMVNGEPQGFGIQYNSDGNRYEGLWYHGTTQGMGTWYGHDGGYYTGGFCDEGRWCGVWTEVRPDGERRIWAYRNGKVNGLNVWVDKDGKATTAEIWENHENTYRKPVSWTVGETTFYAEKRDNTDGGRAIAVYGNGDIYAGDFVNGKRSGEGSYIWPSGRIYNGNWENDIQKGAGYFYYARPENLEDLEEVYPLYLKGTWENGGLEGFGIIYWSDGSRQMGVWKEDKASGFQADIRADGTVTINGWSYGGVDTEDPDEIWMDEGGTWFAGSKNGDTIDGYGAAVYTDGNIYIGQFVDGVREGEGAFYWKETEQYYEGQFKDWYVDGAGHGHILISDRFCYWSGHNAEGSRQGEGSCYFEDGSWYEGTWKGNDAYDTGSYVTFLEDGSRDVTVYENGEVKKGAVGVKVYPASNYYGRYAVFEPGEYTIEDLVKRGISINSISSMEVPEGYRVTVYQNGDLTGDSRQYVQDAELATTEWNDRIASFIVQEK